MIVDGQDTRELVTNLSGPPYNGICLIQTHYRDFEDLTGYGTGFLVTPNRIATAGHVLWNRIGDNVLQRQLPDRISVFLGEGLYEGHPELAWTIDPATAVAVHPDFRAGNTGLDVAWMRLPVQLDMALPTFSFPGDLTIGEPLTLGGYPVDRSPFGAYEGRGAVRTLNKPCFAHSIDSAEGQSGAPVRAMRAGGWNVIGIHSGEDDDRLNNCAVALTPSVVKWLRT